MVELAIPQASELPCGWIAGLDGRPFQKPGHIRLARAARTGQNPQHRAKSGATQHGRPGTFEIVTRWPEPADIARRHGFPLGFPDIADDLGDGKEADGQHCEFDAVAQFGNAALPGVEGLARLQRGAAPQPPGRERPRPRSRTATGPRPGQAGAVQRAADVQLARVGAVRLRATAHG